MLEGDALKKFQASKILLIGLKGLGAEIGTLVIILLISLVEFSP